MKNLLVVVVACLLLNACSKPEPERWFPSPVLSVQTVQFQVMWDQVQRQLGFNPRDSVGVADTQLLFGGDGRLTQARLVLHTTGQTANHETWYSLMGASDRWSWSNQEVTGARIGYPDAAKLFAAMDRLRPVMRQATNIMVLTFRLPTEHPSPQTVKVLEGDRLRDWTDGDLKTFQGRKLAVVQVNNVYYVLPEVPFT